MRQLLAVTQDVLREALSRKWVLALLGAITLILALILFTLKLDAVDTALTATRVLHSETGTATGESLAPIFTGAVMTIFWGWLALGILLCSGFAPSLLAPGRIEHLLSLPIRRWQLLGGIFVAVLALLTVGALYAAGGLSLILGIRTGYLTFRPVLGALMAVVAFAPIYATMLTAAVFVRSAPFSAFIGFGLGSWGILASYREEISALFDSGAGRTLFRAATVAIPRIGALGGLARRLAVDEIVAPGAAGALIAGTLLFALAMLGLAIFRFEGKDY